MFKIICFQFVLWSTFIFYMTMIFRSVTSYFGYYIGWYHQMSIVGLKYYIFSLLRTLVTMI